MSLGRDKDKDESQALHSWVVALGKNEDLNSEP